MKQKPITAAEQARRQSEADAADGYPVDNGTPIVPAPNEKGLARPDPDRNTRKPTYDPAANPANYVAPAPYVAPTAEELAEDDHYGELDRIASEMDNASPSGINALAHQLREVIHNLRGGEKRPKTVLGSHGEVVEVPVPPEPTEAQVAARAAAKADAEKAKNEKVLEPA